ncbi:MAG: hypothetical protein AAF481_11615 [Acidobacteriota bacterium]
MQALSAISPSRRYPTSAVALPNDLRRHVSSGRELLRRHRDHRSEERFPTGTEALDTLLGGGLRRGELTEIVGRRSSGRFSLVLAALAETTRRGEAAAFVDLGDGLDPRQFETFGGDPERLLWIRPRTLKEALTSTEAVLDGAFPLAVLDLGEPPVPGGRGSEAFWVRLARSAQRQKSALLIASPYRASGTAAATVLSAHGGRGIWRPLLTGLGSRLVVDKGDAHNAPQNHWQRLALSVTEQPLAETPPPREEPPAGPRRQKGGTSSWRPPRHPPRQVGGTSRRPSRPSRPSQGGSLRLAAGG